MKTNTAINAATGKEIVSGLDDEQFERWSDHHCADYRYPHNIEEVAPELRAAFQQADERTHFLIAD